MGKMIFGLLAAGLLTLATVAPAFASSHKVTFCHDTGNSIYTLVEAPMNSAHSGHLGDFLIDDDFTVEDCLAL